MSLRGGWLLLIFIIGVTVFDVSRPYLPYEDRLALSFSAEQLCLIELHGLYAPLDGIHQINDAQQLIFVIKMAGIGFSDPEVVEAFKDIPFKSGKYYEFKLVKDEIVAVEVGWMTAAKRIALGIPLSVDSMNQADWADLPGVGPSLALGIELERQKNGDFGSFLNLRRVKGVGPKRLESWRDFF